MNQLDEYLANRKNNIQADGNPLDEYLANRKNNDSIIPKNTPITQAYGNYNPQDEVFSGGVNTGADFGTQVGTPVDLPQGNWKVIEAYKDAKNGYIGDDENQGYGNSVVVENQDTGEKMRFSHLSFVGVNPGETLKGGMIGETGATGNVTGPHLDLEYYNNQGQLGDVSKSPYREYLPN